MTKYLIIGGVLTLSLLSAAQAKADSGYFPYYTEDNNREKYEFSTVAAPLQDNKVAPTPPGNPATNWQPPQQNIEQSKQAAAAPSVLLGSQSGFDIGAAASYYRYGETSTRQTFTGPNVGVTAAATALFGPHLFDTLDGRFSYGRLDDRGTEGSSNDHENYFWEIRDVIGKDFIMNQYSLSPYLGVGFRSLYHDGRGVTDLGDSGFQRNTDYLYLPIGVKPQFRIDGADILSASFEYDQLLHGWQTEHLGDQGGGDPTVHNGLGSGFGLRAGLAWETSRWSIGPYVTYWSINKSSSNQYFSPNATCGASVCTSSTPYNYTVEGGLQIKYHLTDF